MQINVLQLLPFSPDAALSKQFTYFSSYFSMQKWYLLQTLKREAFHLIRLGESRSFLNALFQTCFYLSRRLVCKRYLRSSFLSVLIIFHSREVLSPRRPQQHTLHFLLVDGPLKRHSSHRTPTWSARRYPQLFRHASGLAKTPALGFEPTAGARTRRAGMTTSACGDGDGERRGGLPGLPA